jgi:hypothetical protein
MWRKTPLVAEDVIRKDELASALEARRELGPDYEDAIVEAFVEKVERRLDKRLKDAPGEGEPPAIVVPLASLGLAIPLLGIAGGTGGLAGIVAVCMAIVLVNVAYALRR